MGWWRVWGDCDSSQRRGNGETDNYKQTLPTGGGRTHNTWAASTPGDTQRGVSTDSAQHPQLPPSFLPAFTITLPLSAARVQATKGKGVGWGEAQGGSAERQTR